MATKKAELQITAYCMKTKEKGVVMQNPVITKTEKNGRETYIAHGEDGKGNKMTTILNKEKALGYIEAGVAEDQTKAKAKKKA